VSKEELAEDSIDRNSVNGGEVMMMMMMIMIAILIIIHCGGFCRIYSRLRKYVFSYEFRDLANCVTISMEQSPP
jgi:hypothetical protein